MITKKYHYVYEITYCDEKKYIGVRSCNCEIEDDPYMGSPFRLPDSVKGTGTKHILSTHDTRKAAMEEEIRLHALYDVKNNPEFYNQCNSTSVKFQVSEEAHKRSAETRRGRTKETHEYIMNQVKAREKYRGDGLTPAQKAQWSPERMPDRMKKYKETLANTLKDPEKAKSIHEARVRGGKWGTGKKNPKKGHTGLDHPRAESWWYTKPGSTTKIVVNDSIRNYHKKNNEIFPFSAASIMRYLRDNHIPKKLFDQGWDFGKVNEQEVTNPVE